MKTKLAYLAGVIDSDGCIHIERYIDKHRTRPRIQYILRLQIAVTALETIEWLQKNFSGDVRRTIYEYSDTRLSKRKDIHCWRLSTKRAIELLKKVYPYLVLKKPRARIAIEFEETIMDSSSSRSAAKTDERKTKNAKKQELYEAMKKLNKRGTRNVGCSRAARYN